MDFKDLYDGKNISNMSFVDEVQKNQQNLRDAARAEAIKQDPTLNFVQRQLAQGLLGAKQDWQNAYDAGDAKGMANAALKAQGIREQADAIGWNGSGYGENVSLIDAAKNLANNDTRAVNDIFYGMQRPTSYYRDKYDDMRKFGLSRESANELANEYLADYTAGNVDKLVDAYHMYGTDPRGAINQNGLRILGMMAQQGGISPSELVNFYAKMQATPKDVWNFDNRLIEAENANNYALGRMDRSQQYNRENQERSQNFQKEMAMLNNDLSIQRMVAGVELDIKKGIATKEAGYNFMVKTLVDVGYPEDVARQYAAQRLIGGAGGNNSANSYNSKLVGDLQKERDAIVSQIDAAQLNGDEATVKALQPRLAAIQARIDSAFGMGGDDNTGGVDVNNYNSLSEAFQKLINLNAKRPWNEQRTKAELIEIFLNKVGRDNPMAQDIVNNAEWGGPEEKAQEKTAEQHEEQPKQKPKEDMYTPGDIGYTNNHSAAERVIDTLKDFVNEGVHGRNAPIQPGYRR